MHKKRNLKSFDKSGGTVEQWNSGTGPMNLKTLIVGNPPLTPILSALSPKSICWDT